MFSMAVKFWEKRIVIHEYKDVSQRESIKKTSIDLNWAVLMGVLGTGFCFLALFLKTVPPYHLYYIDLSFCVFFISYQIILSAKAIINFNWSSYFV